MNGEPIGKGEIPFSGGRDPLWEGKTHSEGRDPSPRQVEFLRGSFSLWWESLGGDMPHGRRDTPIEIYLPWLVGHLIEGEKLPVAMCGSCFVYVKLQDLWVPTSVYTHPHIITFT